MKTTECVNTDEKCMHTNRNKPTNEGVLKDEYPSVDGEMTGP